MVKVQRIKNQAHKLKKIQFVLAGFRDKKKERQKHKSISFEDFKLERYILASFESGVHKACWIVFYCLNAMFF